jgi:hypothetical protein
VMYNQRAPPVNSRTWRLESKRVIRLLFLSPCAPKTLISGCKASQIDRKEKREAY